MEEQTPEIGDYIDILKRRKWALILPAVLVMLLAVVVAVLLPSVYQSTATILIEEQDIPANFVMSTVTGYAEQHIQTIQQRIMSTKNLMEIIDRFHLYQEYRDRLTLDEIIKKMRDDIHLDLISADADNQPTSRQPAPTIAFTLSYEGRQADTVQRVADTLVSLFLNENLQVRQRQTTETSAFLKEEANRMKGRLDELEKKLSTFKETHINALPEMLQTNIRTLDNFQSDEERIDEQIRSLKEREGYLETQLASIPKSGDSANDRLHKLELELVDLQTRFTQDYPDVKKTKQEIADLKKRMASNATSPDGGNKTPDNAAYITLASQLSSARADMTSLTHQKADLAARIEGYRRRIENTPKIEEQYNSMVLDRNNTQAKYEDLMRKAMEANVAAGMEKEQKGERFTLIDPPSLPEKPYKPNRLAIGLIGLVLGIGAGVGFAALREFSDQAIYNSAGLAAVSDLPILVSIPDIFTPSDRRRRRNRRLAWGAATLACFAAGLLAFHLWVMDLNVFWAKLMHKIPPM
jgi:succinoglycan biosynthesis transport protein ExoP